MSARDPLWHNFFRKQPEITSRITDLWLATPLFNKITRKHCQTLVPDMHHRHYQPDEIIFKQGDAGIGAVLILSGEVKILSGETLLATLKEGDFFGEVALIIDEPRTASAIAAGDTEVVFFLRQNLDELNNRYPKDGAKLMKNLAKILATRLRLHNEELSSKDKNQQESTHD